MYYYLVAVFGTNHKPLTYSSSYQILINQIVKVSLINAQKFAIVLKECDKPDFATKDILELSDKKFSLYQIELANFISHYYTCELGMVYDIFESYEKSENLSTAFDKKPNLSKKQIEAYEFAKSHDSSLIFGDTGSGKSEIYISLIKDALDSGKQALFLMPEISLTPQMTKRLKAYFGDTLGVWHSKISPKAKKNLLEKFQNSQIKLIAGARSALFLPFTNLGLIVVDEEHDDSYKSNHKPRYNARDLALFIGGRMGIKVVLGSATPSLTTYKKQPVFRLKGTFYESKKRFIYDSGDELSPLIISKIKESLAQNHQSIVFLPTRANYRYMRCSACNAMVMCPYCSVALSYHADKNALKCHYCGFSAYYKTSCQRCGSQIMEAKKIGTTQIVENLQKIFPQARISKFDRDEITTQTKLEQTLNDFNSHKIDILVGTQMLSKGHDYHNVDLAVIMGIDEHLSYPDFRAREKTLALAMQVSGRAGRAGSGWVVIQTGQREFFEDFIEDYEAFLEDEDEFRQGLYPPYAKLLRVLISHKNDKTAQNIQNQALEILKQAKDISMVGHGKAGIEYIAGKFRYEILLRAKSHTPLIRAAKLLSHLEVEIDIDPINFS